MQMQMQNVVNNVFHVLDRVKILVLTVNIVIN